MSVLRFEKKIARFGQGRLAIVVPKVLVSQARSLEGRVVTVTIEEVAETG